MPLNPENLSLSVALRDHTLEQRVREAERAWLASAHDQLDQRLIMDEALQARLVAIRPRLPKVQQQADEINEAQASIAVEVEADLAPAEISEAECELVPAGVRVIDSDPQFVQALGRLEAQKAYEARYERRAMKGRLRAVSLIGNRVLRDSGSPRPIPLPNEGNRITRHRAQPRGRAPITKLRAARDATDDLLDELGSKPEPPLAASDRR